MAGQYDIYLSGDEQGARDLVARVLGEQGFAVESTPKGGFAATRGSAGRTALLGGLAGKNLHMAFFVEFFPAADGAPVVRLSRNTAAGALKGGAIGASRTNNAFVDLVNAVAAAATSAGSYLNSIAG